MHSTGSGLTRVSRPEMIARSMVVGPGIDMYDIREIDTDVVPREFVNSRQNLLQHAMADIVDSGKAQYSNSSRISNPY